MTLFKLDRTNLRIEVVPRQGRLDTHGNPEEHLVITAYSVVGADRDHILGWGLGPNNTRSQKLAQRMTAALNAGVVFSMATILLDIHGKSYVRADSQVSARQMNADLKRLGF